MAESARIIQISDCHLSADPEAQYRGRNADEGLYRLTLAIKAFRPDWLVLTGDLSEDASEASYLRLIDWACALDTEIAWLPGNHDDRAVMAPWFESAGFAAGPVIELSGWRLVLLDSARVNDPAGTLDATRLAPLIGMDPQQPTGVFLHHQPLPVGAAWIDKVMLRQPELLMDALQRLSDVRFVAFGHVHQRFRQRCDRTDFLSCPSSVANSLPATARFSVGEAAPLARWFVLDRDRFQTGYLSP